MGFNDVSGKVKDINVTSLEVSDGISVDLFFEKNGKEKRIVFPSPLQDAEKGIDSLYEKGLIDEDLYKETIDLLNRYIKK